MHKSLRFVLPVLLGASLLAVPAAAQDQDENTVDPAFQDNFTIIDSVHEYDLNPHTSSYSSEAQLLTGLYEGLFSYDPITLEPQPALAVDYRISRDKLRWTFTIRPDAQFSDGSPITAETFRDAWLALIATPDASYSSLLDIIDGVQAYRTGKGTKDDVAITASDDVTLSLRLVAPADYLPRILCQISFAAVKDDLSAFSGPFVIASREHNKLILKRNEKYWDVKNTPLQQITILQSDDADENAHLFNTGDADWITSIATADKLLNPRAIQLNAQFGTQYLFFKKNGGVWDNSAFRRALLEAVPWDKLREGSYVPATTLVYPLNGYPAVEGYSYTDSAEAQDLMKKARADAGISADKKLALTFAIADSEYMRTIAQTLKDAWEPLGVELTVQTTTAERYLAAIPSWHADLFSYTWIGDFVDPLAFLELFQGGSTLNVTGWQNSKFDNLIAQAAAVSDDTRFKLLAQAEQVLLDSDIILPISHPVSYNVIDLGLIGGWSSNSFNIHPLKFLFKRKPQTTVPNLI